MIGDGNGDNARRGKRSGGGGGGGKTKQNNSIKNSIEKRTQDLIERNSPSVHPSSIRAKQSKAKQSHVVSIHQNQQPS